MKLVLVTALGTIAIFAAACGGGSIAPGTSTPASVQKSGMDQTFAGKNACNPKNHDRPFVIEWDATDMSSFEARAANDVIFVHYEGCELKVLDSCVNDSVRGSLGSYKPVEWTSGSLESLDIANEGELYAKLPLGAASLGGRVEGGEKFHMEYFVSGTRMATRDTIHRPDLAKISGCKGATHFVYGYNLGAFALGAQSKIKATVGGSAFGFGAGGTRSSESKADKQGGVLSSCRGESAKEVQTCKIPVRLTLREISDGESADTTDSAAPETPSAANLAGRLKASTDKERKAAEHADAARIKMNSRDGAGCIAELNVHDKMDARPGGLSTNSASAYAMTRGQCLMLAGDCRGGKDVYRKALEKSAGANMGPDQLDRAVDAWAGMNCQGANLSGRDRIMRASMALNQGLMSKKDPAFCNEHIKTLRDLILTTPPRDEDDRDILNAPDSLNNIGVMCLAKSGDCAGAFRLYQELIKRPDYYKYQPAERRESIGKRATMTPEIARMSFDAINSSCKGK
jgi:hypothetical protein